jgi:hypothetical protein
VITMNRLSHFNTEECGAAQTERRWRVSALCDTSKQAFCCHPPRLSFRPSAVATQSVPPSFDCVHQWTGASGVRNSDGHSSNNRHWTNLYSLTSGGPLCFLLRPFRLYLMFVVCGEQLAKMQGPTSSNCSHVVWPSDHADVIEFTASGTRV